MHHRVLVARCAVAKIPNKFVVRNVDFHMEIDGQVGTIVVIVVRQHQFVVELEARTQVDGIRADQVSVTLGIAEAVHMGVETV